MISHISLGTNNLEQARSFYGQLISLLVVRKFMRLVEWSFGNFPTPLLGSR
ncbi:hypothetical protein FIU95_14645 [Microbulbifer sp. THAF38]|nr:hypothetical protein FIU95_14645 [Microbulbifer sp. THAF38]